MDWYNFTKKYVWDDRKTPYLVRIEKLNRSQADHEIFAYVVFLAVLFIVIAVVSLSSQAPYGRSPVAAVYGFTLCVGAVALGFMKHPYLALYCATAPLATLAFLFLHGFPAGLHTIDECFLLAFVLILFRYALRVVAIAKAYEGLPEQRKDA